MKVRYAALFSALAVFVAACSHDTRPPVAPQSQLLVGSHAKSNDVTTTLYVSGSVPVTAYDAIPVATDPNWPTTVCTTVPAIDRNSSSWVNPHPAYVVNGHPWQGSFFTADWINAWNSREEGQAGGPPFMNWSKYTTTVSGNGTYVLQLLADNCSWVYIDNTLVGAQPSNWNATNTKFPVTLNGTSTLTFLIFDGGGQAGGEFRLETTSSFIGNGGDTTIISPPIVTAAPTTTTVSFGAGPFTFTGSPFTATATVSSGGTATIAYTGDCTNAGTTCTATATYAGDASHAASTGTANITIGQAASTTTVSFGAGPFVYKGSAFTATATVSPAGSATIAYTGDCTNAGTTCTAAATTAGDANHSGSSATANITIAKATSTTTVGFGAGPFVYTGSAFTATSNVSPAGSATVAYTGDCTNAGSTCGATATFAGDANHTGSSASASIVIAKAASSTTVSFGAGPFVYKGSAFTATASVSPSGSAAISYAGDCVNGGITCKATATYAGDANHTGSGATASITITYSICAASKGGHDDEGDDHDGGSESGSTIPVKLRVCGAAGNNISSKTLSVKAVGISPTGSLNDSGKANPGMLFRLDDGTYMFNLSTKGLAAGSYTLDYTIGNDPTVYHYAFSIKAKNGKGDDQNNKDGKDGKGDDDGKKP